MADTDDMCPAVKKYLDDMFEPLRQQGINLSFTVSAGRRGRNRINFGDWVELVRIRVENRLGKVVGNDKLDRPRVRWFNSGSWQSARSFFHTSDGKLHVLSPDEARDKFPDAFACYRLTAAETGSSWMVLKQTRNWKPRRTATMYNDSQFTGPAAGPTNTPSWPVILISDAATNAPTASGRPPCQ